MNDTSERRHCPECGKEFPGASALADHATTVHVEADAPAASIRRPRSVVPQRVMAGLAVLLGIGAIVFIALGAAGALEKEGAPETPSSVAHQIAVDLVESGDAEDYRAVVPDDGWDVEYEIDGDGLIRVRDESGVNTEIEVEAFDDDLQKAMEGAAAERGFDFGS